MIKFLSNITLSALLLLSATGMTLNLHYCHNQLIDLALIAPADNCCEADAHEDHCHNDMDKGNSNHCDDETVKIESTSDYVVSTHSFSFENAHSFDLFFTTPLIVNNQSTIESTTLTVLNFKKPPKPQEVVLSQIQSFLI